jgi:nitroimidazol reductase NimA-like FMN-containing flavoprotein (pyridoxamine 5'-phosphate oxidase superfamily)
MDATLNPTGRTRLSRHPERGSHDRDAVYAILDEALICHIGFVAGGQPYVLPTTHARIDDRLYVHGSVASRMLKTLRDGTPMCVTATLIDGLVLARSAFHHSMNYRSAVILGMATQVTEPEHKRRAFNALIEHVMPGRSAQVRGASDQELKATLVLSLAITEASAKTRTGPPVDSENDYALPCWAGVLPLAVQAQAPIADARLIPGVPLPREVAAYERRPRSVE